MAAVPGLKETTSELIQTWFHIHRRSADVRNSLVGKTLPEVMLGNGNMRCFIVLVFGLNVGPLLLTFNKIKKVSIVRDTSTSSKCTSCSLTLIKWGYAVAFLLLQTKLLTRMLWLSLCNICPIYSSGNRNPAAWQVWNVGLKKQKLCQSLSKCCIWSECRFCFKVSSLNKV